MTKKELKDKTKKIWEDHRLEIIGWATIIGALGTGFVAGKFYGETKYIDKVRNNVEPYLQDMLDMAIHVDGIKGGIKGQYIAYGEGVCSVKDLGKLGEFIMDHGSTEIFKPTLDSDVIGTLVVMNNKS